MKLEKRPLFLLMIAYIGGIVCAGAGARSVTGLLLGVGVFAGLFVWKPIPRPVLAMLAAIFAVGVICTSVHRQVSGDDVSHWAEGKLVRVTGTVVSDVDPMEDDARFILRAARIKTYTGESRAAGLVQVKVRRPQYTDEQGKVPSYGETVRIHGRLTLPRGASNPGAFDYGRYLARKRVFCTLSAYTTEVEVLKPSARSPRSIALRFRATLESMAGKLLPATDAALLMGILFGGYASLPLGIQSAFMRSGTMHLLAASGYNCAIVTVIFGWMLRRLTVPRAITHWVLIALVWLFTLVAGPCPSIVRAAIMVTVFLLAYLIWRAPDMYNIVCAAILVTLGLNPMDLYDIGFQLSFTAVFAIVTTMPLVEPHVRRWLTLAPRVWEKRPDWISARTTYLSQDIALAIVLSAVAGIWTWPITSYYFNYLSLVAVVSNALVTLLIVWLTAAGIATLVLGSIWLPLGHVAGIASGQLTEWVLRIVVSLGTHPWSSLSVRSPHREFIALYYLALIGALEYAHRKTSRSAGVARIDRAGDRGHLDMAPGAQDRA